MTRQENKTIALSFAKSIDDRFDDAVFVGNQGGGDVFVLESSTFVYISNIPLVIIVQEEKPTLVAVDDISDEIWNKLYVAGNGDALYRDIVKI